MGESIRGLLIACLAMLAACAPVVQGAGPVFPPQAPELLRNALITPDGVSLTVERWEAPSPKAVIIALHGMNDYAHAFAMPGPWWAEHGITTYAYDQRGFGRSEQAGIWPGGDRLVSDVEAMVRVVSERHPGVPVYLLGESMGGAVAIAALAERHLPVAGLILAAPAVWGWAVQPFSHRAALWLAAHVMPGETFTGEGLEIWPSDNIDMLRTLSKDPLVIKATRSDAIYGLVDLMDRAYAEAGAVRGPILLLYGEKDEVIPREPVADLARALCPSVPLTIAIYKKGFHLLLRDLQAETVWRDIAAWTAEPATPLPSQGEDPPASHNDPELCARPGS